MELAIGILTIFLVLDALFLVLLILLQLPKKEAGLGTAFGGGTTDALFGAGAGNVLTKLTTWGAVFFLVAALVLSIMHKNAGEKRRNLGQNQPVKTNAPPITPQASTNAPNPIKNITPSIPTKNNATASSPAGNTTTPPPTSKSKTGKAPKPKTPPPTPKSKTEETTKPKAPETKKSEKASPPDKGKKAPPAKE
jgi:preprotein translocase subunit SecG